VIKSVNDGELGEIVRFAERNMDAVRAVNFQPVSLVGRLSDSERSKLRITIPECIERLAEQTGGLISRDDWFPIPSCAPLPNFIEALTRRDQYELSVHFACGAATYVFKDPDRNSLVPITRFVDIPGLIEYLDEKQEEASSGTNRYLVAAEVLTKIGSFIDREKQPRGLSFAKLITDAVVRHDYDSIGAFHKQSMLLGFMHFQDKFNHDEERLQRCNIHYINPDQRVIPFCAFNVIPEWYRDRIQQKYGMTVEKWEAASGKKLEDGLYRGTLRRGKHAAGCGCPAGATV
jgi:hypothetical protein